MAKFIFALGAINKKVLYPLFFIIVFALIQIYYHFRADSVVAWYLEGFGTSTGQIMSFFLGNVFNYKKIAIKKQKRNIKNYFIDFIFIFLLSALFRIVDLMAYNMIKIKKTNNNGEGDKSANLYLNEGINIILLSLSTHFILKYKYYSHHFICIAIFVVLCIIVDIFRGYFKKLVLQSMIIVISSILATVLNYTYLKYLMEVKFYFCLDLLSISGLCFFINLFGSLIIILFVHRANDSNEITYKFYEFYNLYGLWILIEHFLLGLIAYGLLASVLEFIILDKLTPNYVVIAYQMAKIPQSIMNEKSIYRWVIFIILILQIICLLFYLEIFECNFCSLSKNTKRNIEKRSGVEQERNILVGNEKDSFIVIKGGYDITEMVKNQELEMQKINTDEEKSENNN